MKRSIILAAKGKKNQISKLAILDGNLIFGTCGAKKNNAENNLSCGKSIEFSITVSEASVNELSE